MGLRFTPSKAIWLTSRLHNACFELIFHPVSNIFTPHLRPIWQESFRVLAPGSVLLAGLSNPLSYIFDYELMEQQQRLEVRHSIPYSDIGSLPPDALQRYLDSGVPLEYGHSLEDQIGGQLRAGFHLTGFYEDIDPDSILNRYISTYIATRAIKPSITTSSRSSWWTIFQYSLLRIIFRFVEVDTNGRDRLSRIIMRTSMRTAMAAVA